MSHSIRIYAPQQWQDSHVVLQGQEAHYLTRVVRVKIGQTITLFGGCPAESLFKIKSIERNEVVLEKETEQGTQTDPPFQIALALAVGKGSKLEEVVEGATALGIAHFFPFHGDHSVSERLNPRFLERLEKIVIESCRQSRRCIPPLLHPIAPNLEICLEHVRQVTDICAYLEEQGGEDILDQKDLWSCFAKVGIFCGPEGGWSNRERLCFQTQKAQPLTLGPRILRMELAAVVAVALVERMMSHSQFPPSLR